MVDEAANCFGPTPEVRDILADCFEPEVLGECTLTRGGRCLKGGHICGLRQGLSQNCLDVVGKAPRPRMSGSKEWEPRAWSVDRPPGLWVREASRVWPMALANAMAPKESTVTFDFHPSRVCSGMGYLSPREEWASVMCP
jgi:hypothetical protein